MKKSSIATFIFYGSLNDFLSSEKKNCQIEITFRGSPGVKDTIESIGVPHTEIHFIKVNFRQSDLFYKLNNDDKVEVFPYFYGPYSSESSKPLFILDVHLGKLARYLRMMGFDTLYKNDSSDKELAEISCKCKRILLTRDIGLLKHRCIQYGYWVRATSPLDQIKEIADRYQLCTNAIPLSRCIKCNGILEKVEKSKIICRLQPRTLDSFDNYSICRSCQSIYWDGSHVQKIKEIIKQVCPPQNDSGVICQ